ncbi:oligosaccharide flippase family protein [Sphingobacterium siyangense]|uniref:PST family polysaccharide transporter n=1 Tax=Sphingobacterium siyangense TaxID=459529 RepID=A0A562MJ88_9SPHI|nr:oligosaccharide flippase family protein [Sphingobacterium siyangense]TWI19959.1 PST family polysaccharide transporter [Sphingobacterium siyangense]
MKSSENKGQLKEAIKNGGYLIAVQAANYILPFLTLPYLLAVLDGKSFGIYIYALGFVQILMIISDFGFNLTITKKIAEVQDSPKEVASIFSSVIFIKSYILIVLTVIFFPVFFFVGFFEHYKIALIVSWIGLIGSTFFPIWYFQGMNDMKTFSLINTFSKFVTYPFIFVLVKSSNDYLWAAFLQNLSWIVSAALSFIVISKHKVYREMNISPPSYLCIKQEIRSAWPLFLSNSLTSLISTSFTVILGFFSTTFVVGAYGAIEKLVKALCFSIYSPISQAFFPLIAKMKVNEFSSAKRLFRNSIFIVTGLMLIIICGYFIFENFIIQKVFNDYKQFILLLRVSVFSILPIALGGVFGQLGLIALGDNVSKNAFSKVYVYTSVFSFPICVLMIWIFGINGAVVSFVLTQLVIFLLMFLNVKKYNLL